MPTASSGNNISSALRNELDIHSAFTFSKYLRVGVDSFFEARGPLDIVIKPSEYWNDDDGFTAIAGGWAAYSKQAYKYPVLSFRTMLPTIDNNGESIWFGFENDSSIGTGLASFIYLRTLGVEELQTAIGGNFDFGGPHITAALPVDYKTVNHNYTVVVMRGIVEFYIDNDLVSVGIFSPNLDFTTIAYPPYAIFNQPAPISPDLTTIIENAATVDFPLIPWGMRVSSGDPRPSRIYRLYDAGTTDLFTSLTIAAGTETSHPLPVFGFESRTFHFRADEDGAINIEILTQEDNWRTYSPDAGGNTESNYTADELWSFVMTGDAVLARLTFDPDVYPCDVDTAEVVMR